MGESKAMDVDNKFEESQSTVIFTKVTNNEEAMAKDLVNSATVAGPTSGSFNTDNISNSDLSYHEEDNNGDDDDDADAVDDGDDYDDYMFDNDDDDDDYLTMQAQFDNVDLPPGVEASFSMLKDPTPSVNIPTSMSIYDHSNAAAGTSAGLIPSLANSQDKASTSTSTVPVELPSVGKENKEREEVMRKFKDFKRFDTVDDFSDHHYNRVGYQGQQPPKTWTKKIQDEWKILEKDLPDKIYVRVYEARMDLLRAVIVGPAGTPYHDGLFVFDVLFPPTYPDIPPMVYYYSGGLRLNPNLYDCGKVCLSLLNTWNGKGNEKWMPKNSTMLQVLVSIQALILNAKPFFNEPGYEGMYAGAEGKSKSKSYNEDVFILSLKTMMYTLRRPPKHFEDFVAGHFRSRAHDILSACRAYMKGAEVGSVVNGRVQDDKDAQTSVSRDFKEAVGKMINGLVSNFIKNGATDCEEFLLSV